MARRSTTAVIEVDGRRDGPLCAGRRAAAAGRLAARDGRPARPASPAGAVLAEVPGKALAGTVLRHPLHGMGYDFEVPMLAGGFRRPPSRAPGSSISRPRTAPTISSSAPGTAWRCPIRSARTASTRPRCRCSPGSHVFKAAEPVIAALIERGALLARGRLTHSYPHSWRSKAPLIFRATPQWFIPMDGPGAAARQGARSDRADPLGAGGRAATGSAA